MSTSPETVTQLLHDARGGDAAALERLLPLLYAELHDIAARHMRGERPDHTLQPTALVHEAFLRLLTPGSYEDRTHFLRAASTAMRHVLVDHARARNAAKRGGALRVTLDEALAGRDERVVELLVLDDALTRLAAAEPRWAQVVELRFFGGLEVPDVAAALGISAATVKRDWQFARAWLARELGPDGARGDATTGGDTR
jgi:RNA polymerase sigma factor (TIGR02999 family)